jgi:hypothetical protein
MRWNSLPQTRTAGFCGISEETQEMTITTAEIRTDSTGDVLTTICSIGLLELSGDPGEDGAALQNLENLLHETFSEIHGTSDISVVFTELL